MPSVSRDPLMASAVTAIFASSAGWRNDEHITNWPSSTVDVTAARADWSVQAS
jgi:hypothetical protein